MPKRAIIQKDELAHIEQDVRRLAARIESLLYRDELTHIEQDVRRLAARIESLRNSLEKRLVRTHPAPPAPYVASCPTGRGGPDVNIDQGNIVNL